MRWSPPGRAPSRTQSLDEPSSSEPDPVSSTAVPTDWNCARGAPRSANRLPATHELFAIRATGDPDREHRPDASCVELELERLRLERIKVARHQHAASAEVTERDFGLFPQADDLASVLRLAREVLLPVAHARLRPRRNDDAGLRAVDSGLEGALRRDGLAVLVLGRGLAQVPDVSAAILRVVVVGGLDRLPVLGGHVANDACRHAVCDELRLREHGHDPALHRSLRVGLAVDPPAARLHRPPRVGDPRGEAARVEANALASLRNHARTVPGPEAGSGHSCRHDGEAGTHDHAALSFIVSPLGADGRVLRSRDEMPMRRAVRPR